MVRPTSGRVGPIGFKVSLRAAGRAVVARAVDLGLTVPVHVEEPLLLLFHVTVHQVRRPHRIAREPARTGVLVPVPSALGLRLWRRTNRRIRVARGNIDNVRMPVPIHVKGIAGPVVGNARYELSRISRYRQPIVTPTEDVLFGEIRALVPSPARRDVRNAILVVVGDRTAFGVRERIRRRPALDHLPHEGGGSAGRLPCGACRRFGGNRRLELRPGPGELVVLERQGHAARASAAARCAARPRIDHAAAARCAARPRIDHAAAARCAARPRIDHAAAARYGAPRSSAGSAAAASGRTREAAMSGQRSRAAKERSKKPRPTTFGPARGFHIRPPSSPYFPRRDREGSRSTCSCLCPRRVTSNATTLLLYCTFLIRWQEVAKSIAVRAM